MSFPVTSVTVIKKRTIYNSHVTAPVTGSSRNHD